MVIDPADRKTKTKSRISLRTFGAQFHEICPSKRTCINEVCNEGNGFDDFLNFLIQV
jgi:hypothetical protein